MILTDGVRVCDIGMYKSIRGPVLVPSFLIYLQCVNGFKYLVAMYLLAL